MSKPIYVPKQDADRLIEQIKAQLFGSKCYGSIEIKQNLAKDNRRAMLYFSPTAWIKMTALVSEFSTEVQWHGLVSRVSEDEFEVYDIIVPPHRVTAATVTSDQEKYTEWINSLDDDTFNNLRFHGHSHVNMAVTPSTVDTDYRRDIITQLPRADENNDVFYIFLIINKSHYWSAEIYDLTNNALYSTVDKEIDMRVLLDDGDDVESFVIEAKKLAVYNTVTPTSSGSTKVVEAPKGAVVETSSSKESSGVKSLSDYMDEDYYGGGYDDDYNIDERFKDPFSYYEGRFWR